MGLSPAVRARPPGVAVPAAGVRLPGLVALALLVAAAAALRFVCIGSQGFWFDEGHTALLVHLSPGRMLGLIPHSESTPPIYYCVLWVWARIFGFAEAGLRSFSALAGVLCVPVLFVLADRLASRRAALIVAALTACNPLLVWYSQEARSYSLLVLLSSITLLAFVLAREQPTAPRVAFWAIASWIALFTHYYAVLIVAPEAALLLWTHRSDRRMRIGLGALIVCGLAILPYAIGQEDTGNAKWIASAPLSRRIGQVVPQFVIGFGGPANGVLEPLAVALVIAAAVVLVARGRCGRPASPELSAGRLTLGIALAGLVINLLLVAGGIDDLLTRNLLALWAPAAVGVGCALAWPRLRGLGPVAAAVLCVIGITVTVDVDTNRNLQRPDWRVVATALGPARGAGRVILIQHYRDRLPLSLYMPRLRFMRGAQRVSEIDVVTFTSPKSAGFCWWGSACNLWPSRSQAAYPIAGFRRISAVRVHQFTVIRLVAPRPRPLRRAEVAGALTTTRLHEDVLLVQRA